jgi:hypothetical protein
MNLTVFILILLSLNFNENITKFKRKILNKFLYFTLIFLRII